MGLFGLPKLLHPGIVVRSVLCFLDVEVVGDARGPGLVTAIVFAVVVAVIIMVGTLMHMVSMVMVMVSDHRYSTIHIMASYGVNMGRGMMMMMDHWGCIRWGVWLPAAKK